MSGCRIISELVQACSVLRIALVGRSVSVEPNLHVAVFAVATVEW